MTFSLAIILLIECITSQESLPYTFRNPSQLPYLFPTSDVGMYEYGAHLLTFPDDTAEIIFYCANIKSYQIRDHILYRTRVNQSSNFSNPPRIALSPYNDDINGSTEWDAVHVCDPRIIQGQFKDDNTQIMYEYAMFYTGTDCYTQNYPHNGCIGSSHNQIGVVFAQNKTAMFNGNWLRLTGNKPIIASNGSYQEWGIGQPSVININQNNNNLLWVFYTVSYPINHIVMTQLDLSFIQNIKIIQTLNVITNGLQDIGNDNNIIFNNAKFAFINENAYGMKMFLMLREQHPYPNDFISQQLQIAIINQSVINNNNNGFWYQIGTLSPILTGYDRNHNAGFCTDGYGNIVENNKNEMRLLYSSATAMTNFNDELWTYLVHEIDLQFCTDQKHCNRV